MYPHRIRLLGPWEYEPLMRRGEGAVPPPGKMTMPRRWNDGGLLGFAGRVRFRRRFGYPGRIDSHERVWLTFAGIEGAAEIALNGHVLVGRHTDGPIEFDVTSLLGKRNELAVNVDCDSDAGGLWGEVALEVRCTAYLRGWRAWLDSETRHLHVQGDVVGASDRLLELYVVANRRSVGYATVEANATGKPCHLELEIDDMRPDRIRVDLVNLAQIWYATEIPVT